MRTDPFRFLDTVARRVPFAIDDYEAAGEAFAQWRDTQDDVDRERVELWAYCYTYRYFYTQFARERTSGASDLDAAIDKAYGRILDHLDDVREPLRFAAFVSVICKRTLLNHRTRRRPTVEVEEHFAPTVPAATAEVYDGPVIRHTLTQLIEDLPDAIREIARMRLLDRTPYEQIAEVTGRPLPTVRTYVSKAVARLRQDPRLRAFYYDDVLPPGVEQGEITK